MAGRKWHSSGDVCVRSADVMEGVEWSAGKKTSSAKSSAPTRLPTSNAGFDNHQELYQAYLNKIIRSAQKSHGERLLKFDGEKGATINFKLLLEHAMAGIKRERDSIEQCDDGSWNDAIDSPMREDVKPPSPLDIKPSRDKRPHSLAATHPAYYHQQSEHAQQALTNATQALPATKKIKLEPGVKREAKSPPVRKQSEPFYRQIHDPKYHTAPEPVLDNPMFRHLNCDTRPDQPKVLSPTFMIALPMGTIIEGANYWPAGETQTQTQPRDPQNE